MTLALLFSYNTDSNTLSKSSICKPQKLRIVINIGKAVLKYFFLFGKSANARKCSHLSGKRYVLKNEKFPGLFLISMFFMPGIQSKPHNLLSK